MQIRRFTKVLAHTPVTEGDSAARWVARLATATGAELTLADVIEPMPPAARRFVPRGWDVPKLVRAEKETHLERIAARVRRGGIDPSIVILRGSPANALVREVTRGHYDLLATDASASHKHASTGATAMGLVRQSPCPVLLARPSRKHRRPRVLVAVDAGISSTRGTAALNRTLIETGLWLADCQGGDLHVLHVWTPYGERTMRRSGVASAEIQQFVNGFREQARQDLEPSLAPFHGRISSGRVHLEKGDPRVEIPRFAVAQRTDLLVIGTVARKGLMARVVGNTAEAVLMDVPCSMLVIKPDKRG
jgi:nucleotide-binding universal stress UspA family protein